MTSEATPAGADPAHAQGVQGQYEGVEFCPRVLYGVNAKVSEGVLQLDANHVIVAAGRSVAVWSTDTGEASLVPPRNASVKGVSALAMSPGRKYLVVGERSSAAASGQVVSLNLSAVGVPVHGVLEVPSSKEVASLAFSGDGKFLAVQAGKPDWELLYFDWESGAVVAAEKVQRMVSKVSFNPWDAKFLVTSGKKHLQLWRLTGNALKPVPLQGLQGESERNFSDHTWLLGDVLIACTDIGEVLYFERGILQQTVAPFHEQCGISCMSPLTKGVIVAGGNLVSVLETSGQVGGSSEESLTLRSTLSVPPEMCCKGEISGISVSLSETGVICTTNTSQMFQLDLSTSDLIVSLQQAVVDNIFGQSKGFHNGAISGLDVAVRRPVAVTVGSADCSVRVWNQLSKKCELSKFFKEDPSSVAVHPLGMMCVVGFSDRLKLCSILVDDIRVEHSFPLKACKEVRFSNGGHLIAAVSQNTVALYSAVTFAHITTLRGHVGQVKAVAFSRDDARLATVSIDGAIYEWSTTTWQKVQDNVVKSCAYTAVSYDDKGTTLICSASDKVIREVVDGKIVRQVSSGPDVITALVYSAVHRVVFTGTTSGSIRAFAFPLTGPFRELLVHSGAVGKLRLSPREDILYSAGDDGVMVAYAVSSLTAAAAANATAAPQGPNQAAGAPKKESDEWLDLTLAGQAWMKEMYETQNKLRVHAAQVAQSVEEEVATRTEGFHAETEEKAKAYEAKLAEAEARVQEQVNLRSQAEARHLEEIHKMEAVHKEAMTSLDEVFRRSLDDLHVKIDQLSKDKEAEETSLRKKLTDEKARHEASVAEMVALHAKEIESEHVKRAKLDQQMKEMEAAYQEEIRQQEEEFEYGLAQAKENASTLIQIERDHSGTNSKVQTQLRKKVDDCVREQVTLKTQIEQLQSEYEKCQRLVRDKEEENVALRQELQERSETVAQKEGRLAELKQKNQELEKFRLVLEYKINELKEQIGPGEAKIAHYKEQIQAMNEEFGRSHQKHEEEKLKKAEGAQKIETINRQLQAVRNQLAEREKYVRSLVESLHKLYTETDLNDWKSSFMKFYQSCVTQQSATQVTQGDQDRMEELARQREYMEHSLQVLKVKEGRQENQHRVDLDRRTDENIQLITEMNRMRRQNKELLEQIAELQNRLNSGSVKAAERVKSKAFAGNSVTTTSPKKTRSPNCAPAPTALSVYSSEGLDPSEKMHVAQLQQLVEQKNVTIETLKSEMDRLAQKLADSATSNCADRPPAPSAQSPSLNLTGGAIRGRPLTSPQADCTTRLPQIKP